MAISRFEQVSVNKLTFGINAFGEYTTTTTLWFLGRPLVAEVRNSVAITERYRIYSDLVSFKFNFTPNMRTIIDNQNEYSITYRGNEWRITGAIENNDKMSVMLMCYRSDPETKA